MDFLRLLAKTNGNRLVATFIVLLGIALSLGCAKKEIEEIKIGAVLCLTGSGAPYGEDALRGIKLAIDETNAQGGVIGKKLKLIVEDDQTDPKTSTSVIAKLINQDKVKVIIGAITSSSTLADAPKAEKARVILFSPGASNPKITEAGDYIFRNWISDALEGKAMADYLYQKESARNIAILYINNDYGMGLKDVFKGRFEELGGKVTIIEVYNQDESDFRSQLIKIKNANPECIYLPGYYREMALILRQAKEIGLNIPFRSVVTFEEPELLKLAGDEAESVIYSSPFYNPYSLEDYIAEFVGNFRKIYGRNPGIFAAHGYDAVKIIAYAINEAGVFEIEVVKNALYGIKNFPGVSGLTSFDRNGDVIKPVAIKTVKNGQFVVLEVLYP